MIQKAQKNFNETIFESRYQRRLMHYNMFKEGTALSVNKWLSLVVRMSVLFFFEV